MAIIIFTMFMANTMASTFKGGDVIEGMYIVKINQEGEKTYKKAQFIVNEKGEYVYCLEPFVMVKNDATYTKYESKFASHLGISELTWERVGLLAFYGYGYQGHTDAKWYYITQMLIWQKIDPASSFYFTDTFEGEINETLYQSEMQELENLMKRHYLTPSFTFEELYIGDTVVLTDTSGVINTFKTNNGVIKDNTLILELKEKYTPVVLERKQTSKPIIYVGENSQNILEGAYDCYMRSSYNFEAVERKGSITIKKLGEGELLSNVLINLYDENKNFIKGLRTNQEGIVTFGNLSMGTYYIEEMEVDNRYILDNSLKKLTLTKDNMNEKLNLTNYLKRGKITIKKYGEGKLLSNVHLSLYDSNKNFYMETITNSEGIAEFNNIPLGTYFIKETYVDNKYILDNTYHEVILEENKDISLELTNYLKRGNITIKKYGEENGNVLNIELINLSNVQFNLYNEQKEFITSLITNKDGELIFSNLVYGTYYLKEIVVDNKYILDDTYHEIILNKDNITLELTNYLKKGSIIIKKYGENNPLSNVKYTLYNKDNNFLQEKETNEDGIIVFDNLPFGTYYIKETYVDNKYIIDNKLYEVVINKEEITFELINYLKKGNINIKKLGENLKLSNNLINYELINLSNIKFNLYNKDKEYISSSITNEDGIARFDDIKVGTYYLKEESSLDGYILDNTYYELVVNENEDVYFELINYLKKGSLVIKKYDKETNEVIANTKFQVLLEDKVIYEGLTNEDGVLRLDNLPYGNYILKEIKASEGYVLDDSNTDIYLDNSEYEVIIYNVPDTGLSYQIILYKKED